MPRNTYALIDLNALVSNFSHLASQNPKGKTLAVIKANAYGHGASEVAKALSACADMFAVAFVDEAKALRDDGINTPLVSLQGAYNIEEMRWAGENAVAVVVHCQEQLEWLDTLTTPPPAIWLKIDTGMHRLGFLPDQFNSIVERYAHLFDQNTVLFTHLASSDDTTNAQTERQLARLNEFRLRLKWPTSIANSGGILNWRESHGSWNRAGIALYGGKASDTNLSIPLQPVMSVFAEVIAVRTIPKGDTVGYGGTWQALRESRIATVAIGYADGYPRHAPIGTPAWCKGQRISLVGRVSMDMLTFDVTDCHAITLGDQVELWGANISAAEVAEYVGTIDYELMTRISSRVPRRYI